MKRWLFLLTLVGFWFSEPAAISLADGAPLAARMAAERGKKDFLQPNALDNLRSFGFESISDLKKAKVDEGFEWTTIPLEKILQNPAPKDFHHLIEPTRKWLFLIIVKDQPKASLAVSRTNGKWEASELSEAGLSVALRDLSRRWPKKSGYRLRYINIMQVVSFVEVTRNDHVVGIFVSPSFASFFNIEADSELTFVKVDQARVLPALREILKRRGRMEGVEH